MGLDMYLEGQKYIYTDWQDPSKNVMEDGFRLKEKTIELGYWRKHPNLHGYIVQTFAKGVDECQEIALSRENLETMIAAVKAKSLPHTTGFFFGESDGSEDEETIAVLTKAIEWLDGICVDHADCAEHPTTLGRACCEANRKRESRSVVYRASW